MVRNNKVSKQHAAKLEVNCFVESVDIVLMVLIRMVGHNGPHTVMFDI